MKLDCRRGVIANFVICHSKRLCDSYASDRCLWAHMTIYYPIKISMTDLRRRARVRRSHED